MMHLKRSTAMYTDVSIRTISYHVRKKPNYLDGGDVKSDFYYVRNTYQITLKVNRL